MSAAHRPPPLPHLSLYRRATAAALVVAPALLVADNLLHPKELAAGNEAEQLAEIAEAYTRWQLAHFLGFVGIILYAGCGAGAGLPGPAAATPARTRRRRSRPRRAAGVRGGDRHRRLHLGGSGPTYALPGADRRTVEMALDVVQSSGWSLPFYLLGIAWIAGMVVLAVGVVRQGAIPPWAGALLVVAAVMSGSEPFIISNAYFVAGSVALLLGGLAVAYFIARMGDREFARGGPS